MPIYVLGLNAYHGDAAAVLLRDGEVVVAVAEERFRRVKHWAGFPTEAVRACLAHAEIEGGHVHHVAVGRDTRAHLGRKALYALKTRPGLGFLRDRLRNRSRVQDLRGPLAAALGVPEGRLPPVHAVEHHRAHLASAFYVSPFEEAAVAAVDGFGDFVSTSTGVGRGARLDVDRRVFFPHSLGLLYTAVTQHLGFPHYGDEFKVMGLAPYGRPTRVREVEALVRLDAGGGFRLALEHFRHAREGVEMTWEGGGPEVGRVFSPQADRLLGPARHPDEPLTDWHHDLAASLQVVFERALAHVLNALWERSRLPRVCLAGGCAMNSVANGRITELTPFREVYVPPAAADEGTALGAALDVWHRVLGGRRGPAMRHAGWGTGHPNADVAALLAARGAAADGITVERFADDGARAAATARLLADGLVVGWFEGRMEWGARALGHRSILADPRRADMRERINAKIKFREAFRPFAPAVAIEALDTYFEGAAPDPFMQRVFPVREAQRAVIPAVTHVDGTARPQAVAPEASPAFYGLIEAFARETGVPVLLNTSFNESEPIVESVEQALDCFLRTRMDALVVGHTLLRRRDAGVAPDAADAGAAVSEA